MVGERDEESNTMVEENGKGQIYNFKFVNYLLYIIE